MYKPKKIKKVLLNEELSNDQKYLKLRKYENIRIHLDDDLTLHMQSKLDDKYNEKCIKEIDEVLIRFEPRKRTAIDGITWWCVFDNMTLKYSTILKFGKYRTKKECQAVINSFAVEWHGSVSMGDF